MGLKLLIIIVENMRKTPVCNENIQTIRATLPAELLLDAFKLEGCKDKKLSEIGFFVKSIIHKEDEDAIALT